MTGPSTDEERRRGHAHPPGGARRRAGGPGGRRHDPFTADFQDFITRTAWGDLWQRPGLGRRERSMLTLAITVALRHWDEFALHVGPR